MTELPPDPNPRASQLDWISASAAENLRACRLRIAFSRDNSFSHLRRPTPATLLGQASHGLAEKAYKGVFSFQADPRAATVSHWAELISEAERQLTAAWGTDAPPAARWPGYQLSRVRAVRRATEVAARRRGGRSSEGDYGNLVEHTLRDEDNRLYGRPDRISRTPQGTILHDLKTGWAQAPEVRPDQRRQLIFYAHLARVELGVLPSRAEIETGDGSTVGFVVEAEEVDALVRDVIDLRDRFNGNAACDPAALASPAAGTCRFCDFRPVCAPYLRSVRDDWEWATTRAGWVRTVDVGPQGGAVDLAVVWPEELRGHQNRVTRLSPSKVPPVGSFAVVANAEPTASPAQVRARWDSSVEVW